MTKDIKKEYHLKQHHNNLTQYHFLICLFCMRQGIQLTSRGKRERKKLKGEKKPLLAVPLRKGIEWGQRNCNPKTQQDE